MRCVTRQPNGCEENQSQHDLCLKGTSSSSIVEPEVTGLSRGEVMNDIFPFHESRKKKITLSVHGVHTYHDPQRGFSVDYIQEKKSSPFSLA